MPTAVLTRDAAGCARYAQALAPLAVIAMPVTQSAPAADPDALARVLAGGGFTAIAVASARAAAALVSAHQQTPPQGSPPLPAIYAVGAATAAVLHAAGLAATVPPGVKDAASLAQALVAALRPASSPAGPPPHVLVPRAEDGREEGLAILRAAGFTVVDVAAYRTVPVRGDDPAIASGRAALTAPLLAPERAVVCAVFAPSQVAALDALVGIRGIGVLPFVAIGETTALALRAAGATVLATAASPTPEGLAAAVAAVYPATR